jgi:hypothetical protein
MAPVLLLLVVTSVLVSASPECAIISLDYGGDLSGNYEIQASVHDGKAIFKNGPNFMFYSVKTGGWNVGVKLGSPKITAISTVDSPEHITKQWKQADGEGWSTAKTSCKGERNVHFQKAIE